MRDAKADATAVDALISYAIYTDGDEVMVREEVRCMRRGRRRQRVQGSGYSLTRSRCSVPYVEAARYSLPVSMRLGAIGAASTAASPPLPLI
jgi:hypothetical protein